ncbi:MAG: helix-turn-helix transcriptional regulator [Pseudomonadota bacterium]
MLDDQFRMEAKYWILSGVYCVALWIARFDYHGYFDVVTQMHVGLINLYSLGLFTYLIIDIVKGRGDDLLEPRRRLRIFFVFSLVLLTMFAIASEFLLVGNAARLQISLKMLVISTLIIVAYLWIFQVKPNHFAFVLPEETPEGPAEKPFTKKENALLEKLDTAMEKNNVWLDPKLTITRLADDLAVSEHNLRAFINKQLGFRNFSAYLNHYRISAIKVALLDQSLRDIPILTIALDHGFNSTPPFNRAFKASVGMTPKAFRSHGNLGTT